MMTPAKAEKIVTPIVCGFHDSLSVKLIPAENDLVDDEIQILKNGHETGVAIQLGYGYAAVNRYLYESGEITGSRDIYFGEVLTTAARLAAIEALYPAYGDLPPTVK